MVSDIEVKLPKWFWGICGFLATAIFGAYLSWMGWMSVQMMAQSGDSKEMKTQLMDIKATQLRQEAVTQNLQNTVSTLSAQVAKSESRLEDQREELKSLREKVYGTGKNN